MVLGSVPATCTVSSRLPSSTMITWSTIPWDMTSRCVSGSVLAALYAGITTMTLRPLNICALCFVLCALCFVLCALCFVLCALCFVLCALCFVLCALYFAFYSRRLARSPATELHQGRSASTASPGIGARSPAGSCEFQNSY